MHSENLSNFTLISLTIWHSASTSLEAHFGCSPVVPIHLTVQGISFNQKLLLSCTCLTRHIMATCPKISGKLVLISLYLTPQGVDPNNFSLVQVMVDRGVSEREMGQGEYPWCCLQQARRESLRQNRMMRFYVKQKDDPHGPNIALYVGNLPTGMSQIQYEKVLSDILGKGG